MHLFFIFLVLCIAFVALSFSAKLALKSAVHIARKKHWSDFAVGFLVLGIATTLPELFIAGQSVYDGVPQLSLGNLIGANALMLSLGLGAVLVIVNGLLPETNIKRHDLLWMSGIIMAPIILLFDNVFSSSDGVLVIMLYGLSIYHFTKRHSYTAEYGVEETEFISETKALLLGLIGLVLLFILSRIIVLLAIQFADIVGFATDTIGIILLAIGTTLPELSLAISAAKHHHKDIIVGDLLGSATANSFVIGLISLFGTISLPGKVRVLSAGIVVALVLFSINYLLAKKQWLTRRFGFALITIYGLFFAVTIGFLGN